MNIKNADDIFIAKNINVAESVLDLINKDEETMKHIPKMLGFSKVMWSKSSDDAKNIDVFARWGLTQTKYKDNQDVYSMTYEKPKVILEDGFIRSSDIGLKGAAGLSVIVDDKTAYYDSNAVSRLEEVLQSDFSLSDTESERATNLIAEIVNKKISKYNHAPYIDGLKIGNNERKVLLVDQRFGDASVSKGMANESTFLQMLEDAIRDNPDSDILIKRHPDSTKGNKKSYFNDKALSKYIVLGNVYLIDFEVNPHCLFSLVQTVYVVTSGMGFEALMAGKDVHCFGVPFYSGWGVTKDKIQLSRRSKKRTINEIFHFSYIAFSKYINPYSGEQGKIEDVIKFLSEDKISSLIDMDYLIINPYPNVSNGITNYVDALKEVVPFNKVEVFSNEKNKKPEDFQVDVRDYVLSNYGVDEVIIESPEARAATILIPSDYKVHVRLHCPMYIGQKYEGVKKNEQVYSSELRVVNKAKVVSSPSYALIKEMAHDLGDTSKFFVYKNPLPKNIKMYDLSHKKYDAVFLGRFQKLKGIEYLNSILELLPEDFNVLIIGNNAENFSYSKKIKCHLHIHGQINSAERFEYVGQAKCLMMLSKFENCSMVILEALSCGTPVVSWNVGGNSEIADNDVLKTVPIGDCYSFASNVIDLASNFTVTTTDFEKALLKVSSDFLTGVNAISEYLLNKNDRVFRGLNENNIGLDISRGSFFHEEKNNRLGKKILGVTISNEHIEELWGPVVDKLQLDYFYICRRPLGFRSVFGRKPHPIDMRKFREFDWVLYRARLIREIKRFNPDKILFHNGSHPMYSKALEEIKDLGIPIIYSELGWFPQKDHVYFDSLGVNGQSYLAKLSADELCQKKIVDEDEYKSEKINGDYILLITQMENDTNLIVNSPRFKKNYSFVKHIVENAPRDEKIIIKVHPLDNKYTKLYSLSAINKNIEIVKDADLSVLIKNAHSVVGINSTVLLQALESDANIYYFGNGLLSNKGVAIDCTSLSFSDAFVYEKYGSRARRDAIVEAFMKRQINLNELDSIPKEKIIASPAFEPFFNDANIVEFVHPAKAFLDKSNGSYSKGDDLIIQENETASSKESSMIKTVERKYYNKKINKLLRSPIQFVRDSKLLRKYGVNI